MSKRTVLFCDRHTGNDEIRADETIQFTTPEGLYEIDLCVDCRQLWAQFSEAQQEWAAAARLVEPSAAAAARQRRRRPHSERIETRAIRLWAIDVGVPLGERGRIPDELRRRYNDEVGQQARERWTALARGKESTPAAAKAG